MMKNFFNQNWKHLLSLALIFLIVLVYFKLQFQGYGIKQHDVQQWEGMAHEIHDYKERNGEGPLWTNSMFGGMPAVQIAIGYPGHYLKEIYNILFDVVPMPAAAVLLSMLGFYAMCAMLGLSPWIGLIGSIAFGFTSYDIIILQAGHNTKALAIALMAPALGAFIMAFKRNRLWGVLLFGAIMSIQIGVNHLQVTYYFAILLLFVGLVLLIEAIKLKKIKHFVITTAGLMAVMAFAVGVNYGNIALTNEYAKYTIRGGNDVTIQPNGLPNEIASEGGLDKEYITQWSYGIDESLTLLSPNVKGGGSFTIGGSSLEDQMDKVDMTAQERQVVQNSSAYWGEQPFTSGPVYIGIVVFYLAFLAMVFLKGPLKWGLLAVSILALMLSWGKNYMGLTEFFIDNIPGYNKFRTVTIILVLIQLTVPLLGVMLLHQFHKNREQIQEKKKSFLIASGIFVFFLLALTYIGIDDNYLSSRDQSQLENIEQNIYNQVINVDAATLQSQYGVDKNNPQQVQEFVQNQAKPYVDGFAKLKEVRKTIYRSSMWRSIGFTLFAGLLVFLFFRPSVRKELIYAGLGILVLLDMIPVARQYLGNEEQGNGYKHWEEKGLIAFPIESNSANDQILQSELAANSSLSPKIEKARKKGEKEAMDLDLTGAARQRVVDAHVFAALNRNTNYRVFDFSGGFSSSEPSYFHKSLGGYHGAKLRSIQNLFEFHLSKSNNKVFDMMNVKYFIQKTEGGSVARPNPTALGNAWFVKEVITVADANEEIRALGSVFQLENAGNGQLLVNGIAANKIKVYGGEELKYVQNQDTTPVNLTNGMAEGSIAFLVADTNGQTNLVPEQVVANDVTQSFRPLVKITLKNAFDPANEVIVQKDEMNGIQKNYSGDGKIKMTHYSPDLLRYESESNGPQLAVFSEMHYPIGWTATVDGKEVEIKKVNYLLRGLPLEAGKHKIEFQFDLPTYRKAGVLASVLSLLYLALILVALYFTFFKKKKEVA